MVENKHKQKHIRGWTLFFLALVILGYVVPFTLLTSVAKVYGAFLFWAAFAIVAVIAVGILTAGWRD
ncbi:hypothetical protein MFMK1_000192 [Metallumcola ferriviriculae]|uniref:Uncharacterized protein n=1 Tax=Metallumcola ferriviriculae TaxID=3039180 RepID=A0AAU0UHN8_9FIRM|nr:hypothetical protein MFMK1_000192 [Desulfitibacteraceae bacterium MK1]